MGGRVDANGSPVSSGPTGASALGPCGVQFMLTGAGLLRTFWELELLKEVRKSGEKFPVKWWDSPPPSGNLEPINMRPVRNKGRAKKPMDA